MENLKSKIRFALLASLTLGLTPFVPEPHILGKIRWVLGGAKGMQALDWWDFFMHGAPWVLLLFFVGQFLYFKYVKKVKPIDIKALIKDENARVIDVREPTEYKNGHFRKAENIPLSKFQMHVERLKNEKRPIIVYCRSGNRSGQAKQILKRAGIQNVYNGGGISQMKKYED